MSLTYNGAHARVFRARGRADSYKCIACGKQATEWALRKELHVPGESRFSGDPNDYNPMCHVCHVEQDCGPDFWVRLSAAGVAVQQADRETWLENCRRGGLTGGALAAERWAADPSILARMIAAATETKRARKASPDYDGRYERAGAIAGNASAAATAERRVTDPLYDEQRYEELHRGGVNGAQAIIDKRATDPEFDAEFRAYARSGQAAATQVIREKRAADPEYDARYRAMRVANGLTASKLRRRCATCGRVSSPAGLGAHQKATGHSGWETV